MRIRLPLFIRRDLPRKLVAVFFAVLIWLAVEYQLRDFDVLHNVPVNLEYDSSVIAVETEKPYTVDITIRGGKKRLQKLKSSDVKVVADLDERIVLPGLDFYPLRISSDNVSSPPGTRVTHVSPKDVSVPVDRVVEKEDVPVRVRFEGEPADGYKVMKRKISPDSVVLRGPSKILKEIREVTTDKVSLADVTQDLEVPNVRLQVGPGLQSQPVAVTVTMEITKQSGELDYHDLPVHVLRRPDSRLRVANEVSAVSVTIHGPKTTLDTLDGSSIRPFIDLTGITAPVQCRPAVHVWIDGGANVTAEYVHPSVVDVVLVPAEGSRPPEGETPRTPAPLVPAAPE